MYRELAAKKGRIVEGNLVLTYEQGEKEHTRVEFAFDIDAINRDRFAPRLLRNAVGLDERSNNSRLRFTKPMACPKTSPLTENDLNVYAYRNVAVGLIPTGAYAVAYKERRKLSEVTEDQSDEFKSFRRWSLPLGKAKVGRIMGLVQPERISLWQRFWKCSRWYQLPETSIRVL